MKKILWFASWYPAENDPYTGDFIQRHALATAAFVQLDLLHVVKSARNYSSNRRTQEALPPKGTATIIYYSGLLTWFPALHRLLSFFTYLRVHRRYLKEYMSVNGKPDGIHVHVAFPAGVAALIAWRRYRIPYIVSEHWTGLCPDASPHFSDLGFFKRWLWQKVMKQAKAHTAVSSYLATQMSRQFSVPMPEVIPNVVDGKVFFPGNSVQTEIQFIHISNFTRQKNLTEIIGAAAVLKKTLPAFRILFIGGKGDEFAEQVKSLGLESQILFLDVMPQQQLRAHLQDSCALILYSLYETFGCVIIEANSCGKPVIVSDLPVFRENVFSGKNGVLIPLHDPQSLAGAMLTIATEKIVFDEQEIRRFTLEFYSPAKIGRRFSEYYDEIFST